MPYLGLLAFVALIVGLVLAALALARTAAYARAVIAFDVLAARRPAAILLCALLSFTGSALVATFVMWPEPRIHDEFSYLLGADTFVHGRLTNPPHPLWPFFESFHIIQQPTYASKYPPAQAAALAIGTLAFGHPLAGVWLAGALMCGAICWMLYAYVTPRWALVGGVIATLQVGIATYWTQSYWGGALAAAGSAIVFGATPRIVGNARTRDAVVLGAGLLLLANSRPFDGAITSLAAAGYLTIALVREPRRLLPTLSPLLLVLALGGAAMAYYNHVVTGHWWLHPYILHDRTYTAQPTLVLQKWRPVEAPRHETMEIQKDAWDKLPEVQEGSALTPRALRDLRRFFVGRGVFVPFVAGALFALTRADGRMLVAAIAWALGALRLLYFFKVHYAAAVAAPVYALVAIGLQQIAALRLRRWPLGEAFCLVAIAASVGSLLLDVERAPLIQTHFGYDDFYARRPDAIDRLERSPGRDLVVVSYGPEHPVHRDWVYNAADIDAADIVWARDMGPERNLELLAYFRDGQQRTVWLLKNGFDEESDGLHPYPDS